MSVPFRMPALEGVQADDVAWLNALVSHAGQPLPLGEGSFVFSPAAAPPLSSAAVEVQPDAGPTLLLVLDEFPFRAMLKSDLDLADLDVLPADLATALREGMVEVVAGLVRRAGLGSFRLTRSGGLGELDAASAALAWFSAAIEGLPGGSPIKARVGVRNADLLHHLRKAAPAAASLRPALKASLLIDGAYTLGRLTLAGADILRLRPGALAVLEVEGLAMLRAGGRLIRLANQAGGCLCAAVEPVLDANAARSRIAWDGEPSGKGRGMDHDVLAAQEGLAKLAALTLDFDLGSVTVPLSDLESWAPGALVPLQPPALEDGIEVTIRHQGRAVGAGELVRIDDRVAVRVTRIHLPG